MRPGRCRHLRGFGAYRFECGKLTLTGTCFDHRLERLRWEERRPWLYASLDLTNMHRLYWLQDGDHRVPRWVSLSWGDGNGDPVWTVTLQLPERWL